MAIQERLARFPFAHTYSIVARDGKSGQMGVAVQSHWFSVGSIVTWGEAGVGVVATQAMVEVSHGPLGIERMRAGEPAAQALKALLAADEGRDLRQVAMLDAQGEIATHTGRRCIAEAGHTTGADYSAQANMMLNATVWHAMASAFESAEGDLTSRLLAALDAAQAAGGDIRGQQSAALLVVAGERQAHPWQGRLFDLRVDDHPSPLAELRRLVDVQRAYHYMNEGDEHLGKDEVAEALACYQAAARLYPGMEEFPFWHAVTLAEIGRLEDALPIFKQVFDANPNWRELARRLPAAGLLNVGIADLERILRI
ncbi:MAG: DUF1028 domain-containing protein [Anaerolineae bacterium]|nr:DUF1028 domain-containing protein [Anaerolineae bacterium]